MGYNLKYKGTEIDALFDKINNMASGEVDTSMSDTSENPVQNKVVKDYVDSAISEAITNTLNTAV